MLKIKEYKILKYPHRILRQEAERITSITEEIFQLASKMKELMIKHDGVGLAANQIGVARQIFVMNTAPYDDQPDIIVALNPVIIEREGISLEEEGCLSFPGLRLTIERPATVRVRMQTLFNETIILEVKDILARAACHEIEHLHGVVFIDHVRPEEQQRVDKYLAENTEPAAL